MGIRMEHMVLFSIINQYRICLKLHTNSTYHKDNQDGQEMFYNNTNHNFMEQIFNLKWSSFKTKNL